MSSNLVVQHLCDRGHVLSLPWTSVEPSVVLKDIGHLSITAGGKEVCFLWYNQKYVKCKDYNLSQTFLRGIKKEIICPGN